jgi:hypothetical protein
MPSRTAHVHLSALERHVQPTRYSLSLQAVEQAMQDEFVSSRQHGAINQVVHLKTDDILIDRSSLVMKLKLEGDVKAAPVPYDFVSISRSAVYDLTGSASASRVTENFVGGALIAVDEFVAPRLMKVPVNNIYSLFRLARQRHGGGVASLELGLHVEYPFVFAVGLTGVTTKGCIYDVSLYGGLTGPFL